MASIMTMTHLKTVIKHKFWVGYYCFKVGLYWQGLTHDLSKFSPIEFKTGCKYANGKMSPIDLEKQDKGYSEAWIHHKGRNKHHYEYWCDGFNTPNGPTPVCMPFKYTLEMFCDYLGAGRAYMGNDFTFEKEYAWWQKRKTEICMMHPAQTHFLDTALEWLTKENGFVSKKMYKQLYDNCVNMYYKGKI